jgi:transposase-like protein
MTAAIPVAAAPQARRIDVDLTALSLVLCPRCKQPLGQDNLRPGATHRYRCKRCDEWTVVIVVEAPAGSPEPLTAAAA